MSNRRYSEDEVREIFGLAADRQTRLPTGAGDGVDGLTLGELQEIGREVGIAPERVAGAALVVERRPARSSG